jgi:saccharopine dehydrogenase (NADP+, L-glutamate forming)
MLLKGDDATHTAMAKTVGLPVGIFVKLMLQGKVGASGVNIPTSKQVYEPVLEELKQFGVFFQEKDEILMKK